LRQPEPENTVLDMENNIPTPRRAEDRRRPRSPLVDQTVDRSLALRREAARGEVERLVRAAFTMIEKSGGLDPKVSEILAEAGLSNQAFYRHFRSKHELLVAVLDEGVRGLADYLATRMEAAKGPVPAIRAWVRGMAAQAQDPAGAQASRPFALARGRLAEAFPAEVAGSRAQLTAPLRAALAEALESGDLPAVEPSQDAELLYHLMMNWIEARLVEGRIPEPAEVDRLEAFALSGLLRAGAPEPSRGTDARRGMQEKRT
jgi:AcrR family transcriptional regulator